MERQGQASSNSIMKEGGMTSDYTSLDSLSDQQKNHLFNIARKCFELIGPDDEDDGDGTNRLPSMISCDKEDPKLDFPPGSNSHSGSIVKNRRSTFRKLDAGVQ